MVDEVLMEVLGTLSGVRPKPLILAECAVQATNLRGETNKTLS